MTTQTQHNQTIFSTSDPHIFHHNNRNQQNINQLTSVNNIQDYQNNQKLNNQQLGSILKTLKLEDCDSNEDLCFKCKKYGELYCCDNCFRSYHWACISAKKLQDLTKMTHTVEFRCQCCDYDKNCIKCNSKLPKTKLQLSDYSNSKSILSYYKCSHCYSKVHKKCMEIPLQTLQKKSSKMTGSGNNGNLNSLDQNNRFQNYLCTNCLQNYGITQIIKSQRVTNSLGIQRLYFLVLLKTKSPTHKGWFQQIVLNNHLKKFNSNQTVIKQFIQNPQLYQNAQIQKIIMVKLPLKYKQIGFSQFEQIIQTKKNTQLNQNYGNPDNFQFLIKWKERDYAHLTWQDQTLVIKNSQKVKEYITQKQKQFSIQNEILKRQTHPIKKKQNYDQYIKIIEHYLNTQSIIRQKYIQKSKIDAYKRTDLKQIQQKMLQLDSQYSKQSFIQIIQIDIKSQNNSKSQNYPKLTQQNPLKSFQNKKFEFQNRKNQFQNITTIIKYLKRTYKKSIILRPSMIVTNQPEKWLEQLQNVHNPKQNNLRYIVFKGNKFNTNLIKKLDFHALKNPSLFKFDMLILSQNYFMYEKQFIYKNIPAFYTVIFDDFLNLDNAKTDNSNFQNLLSSRHLMNSNKLKINNSQVSVNYGQLNMKGQKESIANDSIRIMHEIDRKINFIEKYHIPYKSRIQKQIFLVDSRLGQRKQMISKRLLAVNMGKNNITRALYHKLTFNQPQVYKLQESQLKVLIQKKYKQSIEIISGQNQILNQGQRLSFLSYIMTYGLNYKLVAQMLLKLKCIHPLIWNEMSNEKQLPNQLNKQQNQQNQGKLNLQKQIQLAQPRQLHNQKQQQQGRLQKDLLCNQNQQPKNQQNSIIHDQYNSNERKNHQNNIQNNQNVQSTNYQHQNQNYTDKKQNQINNKNQQINTSTEDKNIKSQKSLEQLIIKYLNRFIPIISKHTKSTNQKSIETAISHYLFGFKPQTIFKRVVQLKILKDEIQKNSHDHSKFPITKKFSFFSSGQLKTFPLWNTYQDYTLGALILEQGYERWEDIINSTKWKKYHSELQTRKIYQFDNKTGNFIIKEQIVPIRSKTIPQNSLPVNHQMGSNHTNNYQTNGNSSNNISGTPKINNLGMETANIQYENQSNNQMELQNQSETYPQTYGQYLMKKIMNSKQFRQIQYERLLEIDVLTQHIAQRGQFILMSMNMNSK